MAEHEQHKSDLTWMEDQRASGGRELTVWLNSIEWEQFEKYRISWFKGRMGTAEGRAATLAHLLKVQGRKLDGEPFLVWYDDDQND